MLIELVDSKTDCADNVCIGLSIISIINGLDSKKATDVDGIPVRFIKVLGAPNFWRYTLIRLICSKKYFR